MNFKRVTALAVAFLAAQGAHAALQGRDADGNASNGYEAYYDTVLNITWLADANYAYTSGHAASSFGEMTWRDTATWINSTVNAGSGLYGVNDWRMPNTQFAQGAHYTYGTRAEFFRGAVDYSVNRKDVGNEIGYMYYVNLGLKAYADESGAVRSPGTYGFNVPDLTRANEVRGGFYNEVQLVDIQTASGISFQHVDVINGYWTGPSFTNDPAWGGCEAAQVMYTYGSLAGLMDALETTNTRFTNIASVWLVTDGDKFAAAVPEPETYALMLAGLALLGARARRAHRTSTGPH